MMKYYAKDVFNKLKEVMETDVLKFALELQVSPDEDNKSWIYIGDSLSTRIDTILYTDNDKKYERIVNRAVNNIQTYIRQHPEHCVLQINNMNDNKYRFLLNRIQDIYFNNITDIINSKDNTIQNLTDIPATISNADAFYCIEALKKIYTDPVDYDRCMRTLVSEETYTDRSLALESEPVILNENFNEEILKTMDYIADNIITKAKENANKDAEMWRFEL